MRVLATMLTSPCGQSAALLPQLRKTCGLPLRQLSSRCKAQNTPETSTESEDTAAKTLPPPPKRNKGFGSASPKLKNPKQSLSESNATGVVSERRAREPRAPGVRRRAAPEKPLVLAEVSETDKRIETVALGSLGVLFFLIFAEGIFLGISGTLSKELDDFAVSLVYPAFTPTVGAFLIVAASYGLFKYLQGGSPTQGPPKQ